MTVQCEPVHCCGKSTALCSDIVQDVSSGLAASDITKNPSNNAG